MTIQEQIEHFDVLVAQMRSVIISKSQDYATDTDTLSNFKDTAAICGLQPRQIVLTMIAIKVARLGVLLNKEDGPINEPIADSILDLANYAILLDMVIAETDIFTTKPV